MDDDQLEEIAEELYGVPPEEFVAARTAARDQARAAGDKALAQAVAALPKPTTAAWVCNLLVRRQPEEVAQLREVGELLRQAQAELSGDELRRLGQQRNQVVAALARQARGLAHAEGHDVSTAVADQVESTLRAAVVDPGAGGALAAGRLTTALSYSGLGPVDLSGAVATPVRSASASAGAPARRAAPTPSPPRGRGADAAEQRRRAAEERRRQELEQARRDAEEAAAVARDRAAAVDAAEEEVTAAGERRDELQARAEQLAEQLRRARRQAEEAAGAVQEAERRRDAAVRRSETAAAIRDRAATRVQELEATGGQPS